MAYQPIDWSKLKLSDIQEVSFLDIDETIIDHKTEKRGFVEVPLSHDRPQLKKIKIFYRLIPCKSCSGIKDRKKPVMIIVNDGPGLSSKNLQTYGNDDSRLNFLLDDFHILLMDQRGTGYSSPLNLEDSNMKPALVATLFDADDVAKDHAIVIREVLKERSFYLMGIGFGGLVLYSYMFDQGAPKPKTFIFANSSTPPYNFLKRFQSQYRVQSSLNYQMQRSYPQYKENILKLKQKLREENLNPNYVNALYDHLGDVNEENWKLNTSNILGELLKKTDDELEEYFSRYEKGLNLLAYILSARSFTPKMTYRTLHYRLQKQKPMSSWMLNGFWKKGYLGEMDETWKADWVRRIDKYPPPGTRFANLRQLSDKFQRTPSLFIFGRDDKSSEIQFRRRELKWFKSPKVQVVEVPGTDGYIFEKGGVKLITRLLNKL